MLQSDIKSLRPSTLVGILNRRNIEENLLEKLQGLEIYKEIFLNASDPIEIFDPDGFYLEQNPAFWNLTGYSENELQGKTPAIHLGKETFSRILKELRQKGKYQGTLISRTQKNRIRHLELCAFPFHDQERKNTGYIAVSRNITGMDSDYNAFPAFGQDGTPSGFIEVDEDISQRKKQEVTLQKISRKLAESQLLLSNVLEYSTEFSIAATDLDFRIILYNKKAEELHGHTADKVIGRTVQEIHTQEKVPPERFEQAIKTVLEKGKYEYNITKKTGQGDERIYHSIVFPMRDRQKKHCGYVVFSHDVTEQKQVETYLSMIAEIGQRLLSGPGEGWKHFTPVLKNLGETAGADRVYIFKNHYDQDGDLLCSLSYEWVRKGIKPQIDNIQNASYRKEKFSRWVEIMSNRGIINGPVHSFPETEQPTLRKQNIQSLLAVPIFIDKTWWGFLELDSCKSERKWNKVEETLLHTVATTLGSFFKRLKEEKRINQQLKEKEVLLREIHHRVKNNLQIVSSLLHLQANQIKDNPYREMFLSSQNRVKAMSLIHQKLYQATDLSSIRIGSFIEDITRNLFRAYQEKSQNIQLEVSAENLDLGVDLAIPCGLIITELVSNSLKHAFPENSGKITIHLSKTEKEYFISVSDNGVGFPRNLDPRKTQTLGLQLVFSLVESQLNGRIELVRDRGTTFNIIAK